METQLIILLTKSKSRQQALKALLDLLIENVPMMVVENYSSAAQILHTHNYSNTLVIIDDVSIEEDPDIGSGLLKKEEVSNKNICALLIKPSKYNATPEFKNIDVLLSDNSSGNQFLESIRALIR